MANISTYKLADWCIEGFGQLRDLVIGKSERQRSRVSGRDLV